tara:strand:- start:16524 stop:17312 length:789 start_codon:yes stop_codon:yes gene_type:complete
MAETTIHDSLFPVKEVPAQLGADIITKTGHKFIVREDTGDVLSCMTDEYKLVQNQQIWDTASPIMKNLGADVTECETFSNGAKTQWKWTLKDTKVDLGDGDLISPEITIRNSYNGQWGLHILAGAFRFICSNGMVIGMIISRKNYKHSIYNMNLNDIEPTINDTVLATKGIFNDELPQLKNTLVKEKHIVDLINMIPSNQMEQFTQYLMTNKPKNYWDLLNSATWIVTHSMKRQNEATHKLEQQIYPTITKWAGFKSSAARA